MKYLLHHSILEQAEVRPDSEAFSCRGVTIAYRCLCQQASQLANALLALGLQPMDRVGIFMGKGIELPVATYGVLLAGGAYVPLDPSAPQHRIEFALRDCGIKILITIDSKRKSVATSGKIDRSELARTWQSNPNPVA